LTVTFVLSTVISTPFGISIGLRPIRDMLAPPFNQVSILPYVADHFAAGFRLTSFLIRHDTLRRGDDGDPESAQHLRHFLSLRVNTQPGLTDPFQSSDHSFIVGTVL